MGDGQVYAVETIDTCKRIRAWADIDGTKVSLRIGNNEPLRIRREAFANLVKALGVGGDPALAEAQEKLAGVRAVIHEFERNRDEAHEMRDYRMERIWGDYAKRLRGALDEPELDLPTEVGAAVKVRGCADNEVREIRKFSDDRWYGQGIGALFDSDIREYYTVVEVL